MVTCNFYLRCQGHIMPQPWVMSYFTPYDNHSALPGVVTQWKISLMLWDWWLAVYLQLQADCTTSQAITTDKAERNGRNCVKSHLWLPVVTISSFSLLFTCMYYLLSLLSRCWGSCSTTKRIENALKTYDSLIFQLCQMIQLWSIIYVCSLVWYIWLFYGVFSML